MLSDLVAGPGRPAPTTRQFCILQVLIGGVILARAVKDPAFRDEILQAVRAAALKEPR